MRETRPIIREYGSWKPQEKGGQLKTLPVFVSLVFASLAFAPDGFAQTPAQGPIQVAQAAGGASQGAVPASSSGSVSATIDRKSTRLNSSHLVISYAVFCLKKKN